MRKDILFLFGIICIAVFFRFWKLGIVPPSPDWDEAALGYNAYSILKTGRDEYGIKTPLTLRSYDDYKPPLYMYLTVPVVAIFGLNTWSIRFPSALLGIAAVLGTYFLATILTKQYKYSRYISLIASFLLAVSPWHIQFSRIAFEANSGLTINIWAIYYFLKGLKNGKFLSLSAVLSGLALYAYHSERIFMPLILVCLTIIYWQKIWQNKKSTVIAVIIGLIIALPIVPVILNPNATLRLRGTSSIADQTGLLFHSVKRLEFDKANGNWLGVLFENRRLVMAKTILDGYLSHYSLKWLFVAGDNPRHHAPDMGLLYLWELPFFLYGLYSIWKFGGSLSYVIYSWIIIAPLAAAPTTELPHSIRTLVFLPSFQIINAFGIFGLYQKIPRQYLLKKGIIICFLIIIFIFMVRYFNLYFFQMNLDYSKWWQYGRKEAVEYSESVKERYQKIVVSTYSEQPHMFFLFFLKYDPVKYLQAGGTASGGFKEIKNKFDKYEFRIIDWDREIHDGSILYIGLPQEIHTSPQKTIYYLDGSEALYIAE